MSIWLKLSCWLIVIGLAACAPTTAPATPSGLLVEYHISGGIAGLSQTWLIYGDGRVEHNGSGTGQARQLSPDQITALVAAIRATNFMALKESYVPQNQCCDRFLYVMTVTLDGQTKTVRTLDAAPDEPPALTQLLGVINILLR
jgi:hypothetical protein